MQVHEPGRRSERPAAVAIADAWRRELPGVPVGSISVLTALWRTAKLFADERHRSLLRLGMDAATLDLLSTLRRAGEPYELPTRELAERCLVTAGAVSQRVARAEDDGLVTRRPAPGGGRAVLVRLTAVGHERLLPVVAALLEHEENLLAHLDPSDRERLASLLGVLGQPLQDERLPSRAD